MYLSLRIQCKEHSYITVSGCVKFIMKYNTPVLLCWFQPMPAWLTDGQQAAPNFKDASVLAKGSSWPGWDCAEVWVFSLGSSFYLLLKNDGCTVDCTSHSYTLHPLKVSLHVYPLYLYSVLESERTIKGPISLCVSKFLSARMRKPACPGMWPWERVPVVFVLPTLDPS